MVSMLCFVGKRKKLTNIVYKWTEYVKNLPELRNWSNISSDDKLKHQGCSSHVNKPWKSHFTCYISLFTIYWSKKNQQIMVRSLQKTRKWLKSTCRIKVNANFFFTKRWLLKPVCIATCWPSCVSFLNKNVCVCFAKRTLKTMSGL